MLNQEQLLKLIRDKVDHPSTPRELLQRLKIPREQRATFKRLLGQLVSGGHLVQTRGNRYGLPDRMNLVVGRITTNPRGFGFVVPDRPLEEVAGRHLRRRQQPQSGDARRPRRRADRAGHRPRRRRPDRPDPRARIQQYGRPLRRRRVGLGLRRAVRPPPDHGRADSLRREQGRASRATWSPSKSPSGRPPRAARSGGWSRCSAASTSPESTPKSSCGSTASSPSTARTRSRRLAGSAARSRSATSRAGPISAPQVTVTIDGEHARDFDDAITLDRLENGNYWLGVHIADVAHYVPEGGALDEEGYDRATSVYFPERAVHMFPSELATGLCSLNPNVDRLVQSCLMEIDRKGTVVRYELHDGVIHSNARMTYTEVNAILTDQRSGDRSPNTASWCRCSSGCTSSSRSSTSAGTAADRSTSISRSRRSCWTTRAWSRRSSRSSATWRIGSSRSSCSSPTKRWRSTSTTTASPACSASTRIPTR